MDCAGDFIVSIPSKASSIALACVGHILEDKICSQKRTQNFSKLRSVLSEKHKDAGDNGGIQFELHRIKDGQQILKSFFMHTPEKVQQLLWSHLGKKDQLNLRLVSKGIAFWMDHEYGLSVIMDTSSETIKWLQNVTSRECYVKVLDQLMYFNFFPNPGRLHSLTFHEDILISPPILDHLLRKFRNLHQIVFYSRELLYEVKNGNKIKPVSPSIVAETLAFLESKEILKSLALKYRKDATLTEWTLTFICDRVPKPFYCKLDMLPRHKNVAFEFPENQKNLQQDSLIYAERQRNTLSTLRLDLGGVFWRRYLPCINQNAATLTHLFLLHVSSTGAPLDCDIFKNLSSLKIIGLSGGFVERITHLKQYLCITKARKLVQTKIKEIQLTDVFMTSDDFKFLKCHSNKRIHMERCLCGRETIIKLEIVNDLNPQVSKSVEKAQYPSELMNFDSEEETEDDYQNTGVFCTEEHLDKDNRNRNKRRFLLSGAARNISWEFMQGVLLSSWLALC